MACDANTLLASAASNGYFGLDPINLKRAILYLLCSGGSSGGASLSGAGSPVGSVTPTFIGQLYVDTNSPYGLWFSTGLVNTNWTQLLGNP